MKVTKLIACPLLPALAGIGLGVATRAKVVEPKPSKTIQNSTLQSAATRRPDPRFAARLDAMAPAEMETLFEDLSGLPEHQRGLARRIAILRLAKRHPQAAAKLALEDKELSNDTLMEVCEIWASADLNSAMEAFEEKQYKALGLGIFVSLADSDYRRGWQFSRENDEILPPHLTSWSGTPAEEAVEKIFQQWIEEDYRSALSAVSPAMGEPFELFLEQLAKTRPQHLPGLIRELDTEQALLALGEWSEIDRDAAVAEARKLLDDPQLGMSAEFLVKFGELAPDLSIAQLTLINDNRSPDPFDFGINDDQLSPRHWQRIAQEIDGNRDDPDFLRAFAQNLGTEQPEIGLEWIESLGLQAQEIMRPEILETWSRHSSEEAAEHLRALPVSEAALAYRVVMGNEELKQIDDGALLTRSLDWYASLDPETRTELIGTAPTLAIKHDPEGVLRWTQTAGSVLPENAEYLPDRSLRAWLSSDFEAAQDWFFREADAATRDELLAQAYFNSKATSFPVDITLIPNEKHYHLASQISDPALRNQTIASLLAAANRRDPQSQLDQASLPADIRADVQEEFDTGEVSVSDDPFDF